MTSRVTRTRVSLYACGAAFMNHRLNRSTETAMSAFHRCGLSALIGIGGRLRCGGRSRNSSLP